MTARSRSVVQVRAVILIAMPAIVRKLIILDLSATDTLQLFALAAATLSLGGVYWLVRDQDRREQQKGGAGAPGPGAQETGKTALGKTQPKKTGPHPLAGTNRPALPPHN